MAKVDSSPKLVRKESIADLVDDLKLLPVSVDGYMATSGMEMARKERIKELKKANGTLSEGYGRILKDLKETRERRHILKDYYQKIKEALRETQAISPPDGFLEGAEECIEDLKNKRYPVLIAGETSAGKSSLINLLLNDRVMPTCIMQNNLTICEISYGPKKEAVIHFAKRGKTPIKLKEGKFDKMTEFIEKPTDDEHWCERIEIKIPNPLLQSDNCSGNKTVITDTVRPCNSFACDPDWDTKEGLDRDECGDPIDPNSLFCYQMDQLGNKSLVPPLLCHQLPKPTRLPCTTPSPPSTPSTRPSTPTELPKTTETVKKKPSQAIQAQCSLLLTTLALLFHLICAA